MCLPLIPWLFIFSFLNRGAINSRVLRFKSGKKITIKYRSFYSYLLKGIFYFFRNEVHLIGPEGDGREVEKPGVITRFLMQELSLFPGRNVFEANNTYLRERGFISDWKCVLKFLFLSLMIRTFEMEQENYTLLNVTFSNLSYSETITKLKSFANSKKKNFVSFVNAHCLNVAFENNHYSSILQRSDLVLPDGIGVQMGCRIKGYHLKDNVNGTDLFPKLLELLIKEDLSLFLLGGTVEVNNNLVKYLKENYPKLKISGNHHGHFQHSVRNDDVIQKINENKSDVLLVAFGVPAQEIWINENFQFINSNVIMGVGGLFDFYSGKNQRAPVWVRELGLEWIYRIYQEPRRMWHRYIVGNPMFIYRVIKN